MNVNINNGAINNTTGPVTATSGYVDYSCTIGTTLSPGVTYPVSITTNNNVNENVRVWLDANNDGVFNVAIELLFSSNNKKNHSGNIIIPAGAITGLPLRLRVAADNFSSPIPTPCSSPGYSQVEDYRITLVTNLAAPVAAFTANDSLTCTNTVSFTDRSKNGPVTWLWNFGDPASGVNNTSALQNPTHAFSAPGNYDITLIVSNANEADTLVKTNYINYHNSVPVAATCTPNTINYCCGYGITNVSIGNGLFTNASANGVAGYENFTCNKTLRVSTGLSYPFSITTGSNPQDARIYIDYNNDGDFTGANELVAVALNTINPVGTITIPATATLNTPLRMRIISDNTGSNFTSCSGVQSGQAEDYTVIITPDIFPVPQFTSTFSSTCDTVVTFAGQSSNSPHSWLWNFGDPASGALNTSTLQNPTHVYRNPGSYTVTLVATNANGSGTVVKNKYLNITKPCITYCPSQNHSNSSQWIAKVQIGTLSNVSGPDPLGYGNYTYLNSDLVLGSSNPFTIELSTAYYYKYVTIWIDLNKDGVFQNSERMFHDYSNYVGPNLPLNVTGNIVIPNNVQSGFTRMRVNISDIYDLNNPCISNITNGGETEDYLLTLLPNTIPLVGDFSADLNAVCSGTVPFRDASVNGATSWYWNFGDPASGGHNTSTLQNPTHTYPTGTSASYTVTLVVCKGSQCDTIVKTNYINVPVPCRTYCISDGHYTPYQWISNVTLGNLNNPSASDPNGYGNYTNKRADLVVGSAGNPISVTIGSNFSTNYRQVLAWIDFNRNGFFEQTEMVFNETAYSASPQVATGNISVPASALPGFTRMRVLMTDNYGPLWNPCIKNVSNTESEDYTINILPNAQPVTADFQPDMTGICSGTVQFLDRSLNGATSWYWDFGDPASGVNNTSTLQDPIHIYPITPAGNYTVKLIACKGAQCDTIIKINLITTTVPCQTYCASSGHFGAGRYISKVAVSTINNASGAEPNGYGNYTYLKTDLMLGLPNPIAVDIINSGVYMYVFAWIDFNQDGQFQANEQVFNKLTTMGAGGIIQAAGNITLPGNALPGLTRMRVVMSSSQYFTNPCQMNATNAEVEDYLVNILPNPYPVVADYTANMGSICQGSVQFYDASQNGATSWYWDFGDPASGAANTSTLQNPIHTYSTTAAGSYDVTFVACKTGVCDTLLYSKSVNISVPCNYYCINTNNTNTGQWIGNVTIGNINNNTGAEVYAYGNYTYLNTFAHAGMGNIPVSVTLGKSAGAAEYITIWIDFNHDNIFQQREQVFNMQAVLSNNELVASGSLVIPGKALLGPTRMRVLMRTPGGINDPCPSWYPDIEVEDYTIIIVQNPAPPVSDFSVSTMTPCYSTVSFSDSTTNTPTSWSWNFGDPNSGAANTSTLQHPQHTFSAPSLYTITLVTTNAFGSDTLVRTNYINYDPTNAACQTVLMPVSGTLVQNNFCSGSLYDDGGPSNFYSNNVNGTVVIAPPNAATVSITFTQFNVDTPGDVLKIFDGPDTTANLIGTYYPTPVWGLALPNSGAPITSTGGAMTIQFISNSSSPLNGFSATWNCNYPNTDPPVSAFSANSVNPCYGIVSFSDSTINTPTSWLWNFGDPNSGPANTSSLQNPTHAFSAPGLYTITLVTTNAFGSDTLVKTNYINYNSTNVACRTVLMPVLGTLVQNNFCSGVIYDDGGPTGAYKNNVNGTVVIAPPNAASVSLFFTYFDVDTPGDVVRIYDGANTASPLIGTYHTLGSGLPNNGAAITSSGGAITMQFITNSSYTLNGFIANWQCNLPSGTPEDLEEKLFEIYPNPSTGLINLTLKQNQPEPFNLEITNVLGQVLIKKPVKFLDSEPQQLDLSKLGKGVYFIKIRNDKFSGIKKLVLE
ncbi:GEVED domain-containing protein [Adhaeribacter terreus]|uniref:GEVED domain-containing protein n=1 Tax=Adhaeribacter terreus TaxID=529703 RepID=UPI00366AF8C9